MRDVDLPITKLDVFGRRQIHGIHVPSDKVDLTTDCSQPIGGLAISDVACAYDVLDLARYQELFKFVRDIDGAHW